ncbi:MAG TPA: type VI secretion system-associated FHA domain protein TagH [Aquabacterium sp.]|nr:type VI secretion system-associated FHA domain protein TagH [Aquabacterium sp.]HQC94846.1 type VI secretion system-associated FHA domain protein TagH [Aquabacterium sp.]
MIVLTVVSFNGAPTQGLSASFDELGGSIGRADGNQLVLPDPERSISRQHARVVFRSGGYAIVDNGSNPIAVNGQPVPLGREQPLAVGDTVQIGSYALQVAAGGSAAAPADPFADLFGDGAQGLAAPAVAAMPPPAAAAAPAAAAGRAADPWATPVPWTTPAAAPAPAAPPWAAAPAPAWPAPPPPAPAAAAATGIPDDWDFLAPGPAAPAPAAGLGLGLGSATPQAGGGLPVAAPGLESLDDLFGLAAGAPVADPLGAPQARALLLQPNTAGQDDPLQALAGAPAPVPAASVDDHASALHTPMPLPPAAAPSAPRGAVFSWDNPPPEGRVVTLPGMPSPNQPRPPAAPAAAEVPHTLIRPVPVAPATAAAPAALAPPPAAPRPSPPVVGATTPPVAGAGEQVLLAALLQGLDTPGLRIDQLTPELMQRLGQLLRESTRGAVELLAARAALKREMRAMMTMIQGRENNPLKFSPTVDAALLHLMGPAVAGFMAPAPAMRDAFDDLRAHQLGLMAGMKAAMEGMLQRFDPQQLETQLAGRAGLAGLIPATRKARLWEAFQQLFGQLSAEAQDDVDALFGKAFLRAYQDQLDRLQAEPPASR